MHLAKLPRARIDLDRAHPLAIDQQLDPVTVATELNPEDAATHGIPGNCRRSVGADARVTVAVARLLLTRLARSPFALPTEIVALALATIVAAGLGPRWLARIVTGLGAVIAPLVVTFPATLVVPLAAATAGSQCVTSLVARLVALPAVIGASES